MKSLNFVAWGKRLPALFMAATLAACGGGGGDSGSSFGGTPTKTAAKIDMSASADSVASATGDNAVTVTAVVKDSSNSALASYAVTFSASSGVLQSAPATTDASGQATVKLSAGADRSNRTIVVRATAGSVSSTVSVPVVGTKITLAGSTSLLLSGGTTMFTAKAVDSAGAAIPGATLNFQSTLGNTLSSSSATTDASGFAQVSYTPVKGGIDTLSVTGLGTSAQQQISISAQAFAFVTPATGSSLPTNAAQTVTVQIKEGTAGVAGQTVSFATTRGVVSASTAVTDASGLASTTLSSTTAGPATLTATTSNGSSASQTIEFVATVPATLALQANPSAVIPNTTGSSTSRSTLTAVVRDINGNPVKGATVNFSAADPSGGSISPATAVTDATGQAQSSFIAGTVSTATNGVVVTATVASNTSISGTAKVTVNGRALFITVGTGNQIEVPNTTTYSKPFNVYVTDSNGAAIASQPVVLSVYANLYRKGKYVAGTSTWSPNVSATCANEDVNQNGILDPGEDTNGDGRLTPGGVALVSTTTVTTDATGFASFSVLYGKQYSNWTVATVKASATVAGTESTSAYGPFTLPVLAADVSDLTISPPGFISPFGQSSSCTDAL